MDHVWSPHDGPKEVIHLQDPALIRFLILEERWSCPAWWRCMMARACSFCFFFLGHILTHAQEETRTRPRHHRLLPYGRRLRPHHTCRPQVHEDDSRGNSLGHKCVSSVPAESSVIFSTSSRPLWTHGQEEETKSPCVLSREDMVVFGHAGPVFMKLF